jgi:hypothetical protein
MKLTPAHTTNANDFSKEELAHFKPLNSSNDDEAGWRSLLNRTGDRREHVVRVRANESNRSDHEYEDYGQHDRIFGDVLTLVIFQES